MGKYAFNFFYWKLVFSSYVHVCKLTQKNLSLLTAKRGEREKWRLFDVAVVYFKSNGLKRQSVITIRLYQLS